MPNHEDYVWHKEHGICPACRHAKASPGRVLCDECLEKQRETDRIRRKNKDRTQVNSYQKERRERLKASGMCFRCGKRKAECGKTMCSECAIKYRRWDREWHSKHSRHFKETGQCQWCDSMAIPGKNYCQKHYYDLCERIAKGRKAQKDKANCKRMNNAFWMEHKRGGVQCT